MSTANFKVQNKELFANAKKHLTQGHERLIEKPSLIIALSVSIAVALSKNFSLSGRSRYGTRQGVFLLRLSLADEFDVTQEQPVGVFD